MMKRNETMRDLDDAARVLRDALTMDYCPYITHGGQCVSGCWSEPRCITEGPPPVRNAASCITEGPPPVRNAASWVVEEARHASRVLAWHGDIKHARDIMRWAGKIGARA